MKCYVYQQQILCYPDKQRAVLNDIACLLSSSKARTDAQIAIQGSNTQDDYESSKRVKLE